MSREIDTSKPLSEADYLHLRDRNALPEDYKVKKEVRQRPEGSRKAKGGPAADTTGDPSTAASARYDVLSIDEVRSELNARGLDWEVHESKPELVERLSKHAHDEDDEEEVF